ncbi:Protein SMAX1-LIKE like [Actinidia chinensis var. chinensis]|uniref:Protein SMAX1-LIKE like n=1 Tax=Actinidia chinensis var. chinensis TaxID=1590841 RepID=A0A2R6P4K5_ACTCC|nr:Protein SMAX1-LIKE like [Actinidia chinensis var. chinensis]
MRAGGACTVQQTLTTEAASVLKHSLGLARRRGHAQVTPLHVAATLLSPRASLLKRACLKSQQPQITPHHHSHPLQCRALELCFNVALNRLPTTPSPLLHAQQPSLSNALIAALKRAQAHQRRGSIEQQHQNQPLLAIKVELEQLILSILDDPSVSRVMREAGFSSTAVKNNLEDYSLPSSVFSSSVGGVYSSPSSPSPPETTPTQSFWQTHLLAYNSEPNPFFFSPQKRVPITESSAHKEDIKLVFEVLLGKKRKNTVIVGDSVSITERLVSEIMDKIDRKDVPDELKSVHFIKFLFSSVPLRFMKREEVEMNLADLKRKVDSSLTSGGGVGVIIYTGDLKWAVGEREISGYNPVDHLVSDIGRLICEWGNSSNTKKVWLMGTANYQTYMRCQMRQPSLEIQWSLQAISVPSGGLGLSLHATTPSANESRINLSQNPSQVFEIKPFCGKEDQDELTCCEECTSKYEKEVGLIKSESDHHKPLYISSCNTKEMDKGSTQLPHWLQSQPTEKEKNDLVELRRKWNRLCQSQHQGRHIHNHTSSFLFNNQNIYGKSHTFPSSSPCLATRNTLFPDTNPISFAHSTPKSSSLPRFRRQQSCHIEFSFSSNGNHKHQSLEPNLDSLKNTEEKEVKITLSLGNSNSQFFDTGKLGERKSEISKNLQENVPWQLETIPLIVEALIEYNPAKKGTNWLLIQGNDSIGKRRLARGIAESVFDSADLLLHLNMREKEGEISLCCKKLERALRDQEKLVVLVEDVDFADTQFLKFLSDGYETGKFGESGKNEGKSGQVIFIITKGDSSKDLNSVTQIKLEVSETIHSNKRKLETEWDLPNKAKSPRIDEKENTNSLGTHEKGNVKKEFTRQSSSNTLDLNMKANEEDNETEAKEGELSPISSDLTREMGNDYQTPHGILESIKNRFVFNRDSTRDDLMKEIILCNIKGSFEEVCGIEGDRGCLFGGVEKKLLEELLLGCGSFLNNHFKKWLKDVFQTSLQTVKFGGKEGVVSVRLYLGGKGESELDLEGGGFMGSSLPKKIQVSFMG